jgi:hypothetical protein
MRSPRIEQQRVVGMDRTCKKGLHRRTHEQRRHCEWMRGYSAALFSLKPEPNPLQRRITSAQQDLRKTREDAIPPPSASGSPSSS